MDRLARTIAQRYVLGKKDPPEDKYSAGHLYYCPEDQTVLLTKRSGIMHHPYKWDIPGGRSDKDDKSPEATAAREAKEELSKLPKEATLLDQHTETWEKDGNPNYHYHVFLWAIPEAEKVRWTAKIELDEENLGFKWFKIDELPTKEQLHFDLSWLPKAAGAEPMKTASRIALAASLETLKPRFEHKFWLPLDQLDAVRTFIRPYVTADDHGLHYTIRNIYLDNPELEFFADHVLRRKLAHMKLRARSYEADNKVFLEVKQKSKGICSKSRSIVPAELYGEVLKTADRMGDRIPFLRIALEHHSRPIVRLDYNREAYNAHEASGRVTVDTNVRYALHKNFAFGPAPSHVLLPENVGILELKFTGESPQFMKDLKRAFDLRRASISKYCLSVGHMIKAHELDERILLASV